jgi:hypothetical protein
VRGRVSGPNITALTVHPNRMSKRSSLNRKEMIKEGILGHWGETTQ